jgi:uncharacterized protein YciI
MKNQQTQNLFLAMLKYLRPLSEVDAHLVAHRAFLDQYYQSKQFLCSGPMNPREGGVILAKAESKDELEKILRDDPFQKNGIAEYKILEFTPVKMSPEFAKCL